MKVAQLGSRSFPAQHGGLEMVVEALTTALAANGHRVAVFVSSAPRAAARPAQVELVVTRSFRSKYLHTLTQVVFGILEVRRLRPDVVHVHGVGSAIPLLLSRRIFGRSGVVVTAHGLDWERSKWPRPAKHLFKILSVQALKRAGAVTAVSGAVAEDLRRLVGCRVEVIANAVAGPPTISQVPTAVPAEKYSVVVSRMTPEKNIEQVVTAYNSTVEEILGPLVVVGGGSSSYSDGYEQLLREIASPRTIFTGSVPPSVAWSIIRGSDRLISASRIEGQPLSVMEAMSLGKPIYVSDIAAHRELCGEAAVYFPLDDSSALRDRLLASSLHDDLADRITSILQRAGKFSWEDSVNRYLRVYEEVRTRRSADIYV